MLQTQQIGATAAEVHDKRAPIYKLDRNSRRDLQLSAICVIFFASVTREEINRDLEIIITSKGFIDKILASIKRAVNICTWS